MPPKPDNDDGPDKWFWERGKWAVEEIVQNDEFIVLLTDETQVHVLNKGNDYKTERIDLEGCNRVYQMLLTEDNNLYVRSDYEAILYHNRLSYQKPVKLK